MAGSPEFCGPPPVVGQAAHNASLDQEHFHVNSVLSYRSGDCGTVTSNGVWQRRHLLIRCNPGYLGSHGAGGGGFSHSKCLHHNSSVAIW